MAYVKVMDYNFFFFFFFFEANGKKYEHLHKYMQITKNIPRPTSYELDASFLGSSRIFFILFFLSFLFRKVIHFFVRGRKKKLDSERKLRYLSDKMEKITFSIFLSTRENTIVSGPLSPFVLFIIKGRKIIRE